MDEKINRLLERLEYEAETKVSGRAPVGKAPKGGWTPLAAAKDVARRLRKTYDSDEVAVWDAAKVKEMGWGSGRAPAGIAWEGGPYDWAVTVSLDPVWMRDYPGVFMEPYSGWLLYFYEG
jgi:hypothetical protein